MKSDIPPIIPPLLEPHFPPKQRAPTLSAIILFKVLKAFLLIIFAFAVYTVRDLDLYAEFRRVLIEANLDPASNLFAGSGDMLRGMTPLMLQCFASGGLFYGIFSLVEAIGLFLRAGWGGWMAIIESALFLPVEVWDLSQHFSLTMVIVLFSNFAIFLYLYLNRRRLFSKSRTN